MSGNLSGRPAGIIEKGPRNLQHLQDKAIEVLDKHLDEDSDRVAMYVYDQNMGTARQQASPVELLEAVIKLLMGFPEAAAHLKSQLLTEEPENALPASEIAPS